MLINDLYTNKTPAVTEANDPNFEGFMNNTLGDRVDAKPEQPKTGHDWYDNAPTMSMDNMPSYKHAFKFGMSVLQSMDAETKQHFAEADNDELFSYLMKLARKKRFEPKYFVEEDMFEVTGLFKEIFHDPSMADWEWSDLLRSTLNNQGVAEGLSEARNSLFAFVKQHFPSWPDYVLKDFLYAQAKGIRDQAELDDFLKRNKQDFGNCKWTLTKLPITFDIFTPKTQRMLASREGGSSNPFQVPKDAERHARQSQMIQQKGVSAEPIIVAKLSNGYDLIEGWHRTIQQLKAFPQGYTGPAWVCTGATYKSESVEQGVAESEAWQKANNRDKTDGMSQKSVNVYRREHPGSKLKTAVTTKPSKLKKGGKASKRRKSYCSRSRGQMKMHSISCAKTPDKAICKARRRWNC